MVLPFSVNALEEEPRYEASLKFYKVDEEWKDFFYSRKLKDGWVTSVFLKGDAIEIEESEVLKSGDIIAVGTIVKLIDGKIPDASFLNISYKYDTNVFETKESFGGNDYYYQNILSVRDGGAFPFNKILYDLTWKSYYGGTNLESGVVQVNFKDSGIVTNDYDNKEDKIIFLSYLKVKEKITEEKLNAKFEYLKENRNETISIGYDSNNIAYEKFMKYNNASLSINGLIDNNDNLSKNNVINTSVIKRNGNKELNEIVLDNVMPLSDTLIKSYEIVRNSDEDYVIGIDPYTTINTFINSFVNESDYLNVYDFNGNLVSDLNQYVGNGMVMKLEKNGEVLDTLRIIVRGDINGNGRVNWADSLSLDNYIVKLAKFDKYQTLAADITKDGKVNGADQLSLENYVIGILKNLN